LKFLSKIFNLVNFLGCAPVDLRQLAGEVDKIKKAMDDNQKWLVARRICFSAYRKTPFKNVEERCEVIVTYEKFSANFGDAMNLQTGVFTAPADGAYYFAFNAFAFQGSGSPHCRLHLLCNDKIEANSHYNGKNRASGKSGPRFR
jgi:C1q domain